MTSGNGAYAGGSLIGARNRTHQGYLIASFNPPTERYVVLEQISEFISVGGTDYDLETSQHRGGVYSEGQKFLKKVTYDGTVRFEYELGPSQPDAKGLPECEAGVCTFSEIKHIALARDENTAVVDYTFTNYSAEEAFVYLTPAFTFREHNTLKSADDHKFADLITGDTLSLVPYEKDDIRIDLSVSEGRFLELADKYDEDVELQTEVDLETEGLTSSYIPYDIEITVAPGEKKHVSVICTVERAVSESSGKVLREELPDSGSVLRGDKLLEAAVDRFVAAGTARKLIAEVREYYHACEERGREAYRALTGDSNIPEFFDRLVLDADHFIAFRRSTGLKTVLAGLPWFTDWGRDTMIAFTGLTLCTGRFGDAREILSSFAKYERHGLIPNMFPDDGAEPLYNTADASLWYFIAVHNYLNYTAKTDPEHAEDADSFIRSSIYPTLVHILEAYEKGTDNSIYMEPSGLIHAGSGLDQVTWMDVRVGSLVVTPRHGCPVEINALWYNALRIGAGLAERFGDADRAGHWTQLAERVESVYEKTYYSNGYLYDVVDGYAEDDSELGFTYAQRDDSLRPNQIFAVSLPFSPVSEEAARSIVERVERVLYVGVGLRSLSPAHPDYHGQYRGALEKRDLAYHQGTAWGYLLGAYIDAYCRVHRDEPDLQERVEGLLSPVKEHLPDANCIGGFCEVFEGDVPHTGRGCYTQAWSTAEILRAFLNVKMCYTR
ncbi:MAG: glycogen debranching enzyme family protein [Lachnospiraceae bacterium]|nr:glycogen debranching enzyme family protein [Lachnospiraceae bacterium]